MDSELTQDERRRIADYCDTPPTERDPELLRPGSRYADDVRLIERDDSDDSRLRALADYLRWR